MRSGNIPGSCAPCLYEKKKKMCMTFSKDSVNLKHLMHHFENVVNSEGFSLPLVTKLLCVKFSEYKQLQLLWWNVL